MASIHLLLHAPACSRTPSSHNRGKCGFFLYTRTSSKCLPSPVLPVSRPGPYGIGCKYSRQQLRGDMLVLREAVSANELRSFANSDEGVNGKTPYTAADSSGSVNGNGNGVVNGYVNGASLTRLKGTDNGNGKVQPGSDAQRSTTLVNESAVKTTANSLAQTNIYNGASSPATSTGSTLPSAAERVATSLLSAKKLDAKSINAAAGVEGFLDPCAAGQLEACAAERVTEMESGFVAGPSGESPFMKAGGRWSQFRSYSTFQRTFEIWKFAITFFVKMWLVNQKFTYGKTGMTPAEVSKRKQELACWLREGLVRLGPTFIKIGQQFSTRVDVLSQEFIKELEMLQDNVPPFSTDAAKACIEEELGAPVDELFQDFDPVPIAAASLGQVHLAKLEGERVVVKVQRPGLKELFDIDLKNIRVIAQWLQNVDPKTDGAARDWVAIYDECSRILYEEIDYKLEGQNADKFRTNFASKEWVKVPKVLWPYTSTRVLTMEYAPGVKINRIDELDALGLDRKRLARLSVESYLEQLLTYGFFHADPHPGNIAVDAANGGRLIYYDFGMMGTIPNGVRKGLLELFYGVYEKDPDRCLDALVDMGVLVPTGDRVAVRRTAEFFLASFQERLQQQREEAKSNPNYGSSFKPQVSKDEKKARRKQILASIGEDLLVASADKPFRFPATFTFVVRSFTVLDGIGKGLDPRFDISEIAAPYARNLLLEAQPQFAKLGQELKKKVDAQNRAVVNLFRGPNLIDDMSTTVMRLERGDLKLRVRALEAERALDRVAVMQRVTTAALLASALVNLGTVLSVSAMQTGASLSFAGAAAFAFVTLINWIKVQSMEKRELQLTGA